MIAKNVNDIALTDLKKLVEDNVQERKTLEYKATLPDNSDSGKKEFLADISSLANTQGGDLIFGLKATDGVLQNEIGMTIIDADAEIARLENIARDGISPRIGLEIGAIDAEAGKKAIIIRTKASLEAPHRVVFKEDSKFYKRNSNGKYPMDVGELRGAFLQSGELAERIRKFREYRVGDIKAGTTPYPLQQNESFIAIHIVPLSAYSTSFRLPSSALADLQRGQYAGRFAPPYGPHSYSQRINLDGIVTYSTYNDPIVSKYAQLYRDGKFEAVDTFLLGFNVASGETGRGRRMIPMWSVESGTMEYVQQILGLLGTLGFQPPFYVFVSFIGTKGKTMSPPSGQFFLHQEEITQNELLLPEVVIENTTDNLHHKFRPVFDLIWNAAGMSHSLNFDADNNLNPHN